MSEFPAALKQARLRRRLSQGYVAAQGDVSHSYLSRLESGERHPTRETVLALAGALGCDDLETDELLVAANMAPASDELREMIVRAMRDERRRRLKIEAWAEAVS